MAHPIHLEQLDRGHVRIVRPGGVYAAATAPAGDEVPCAWFAEGAVPDTHTARFAEREAQLLLPILRRWSLRGERTAQAHAKPARTADGATIEEAMAALDINQAGLADRLARAELGEDATPAEIASRFASIKALLSNARKPVAAGGRPLTEERRRLLEGLIETARKKRSRKA